MGHPNELLNVGWKLVSTEPVTEAALRRAVSSAYYALFHLLIEETCGNWLHATHRPRLSRQFDHGRMRVASDAWARKSVPGTDAFVVADTFVYLQQRRHEADYDITTTFDFLEVTGDLSAAELAFQSWERIRGDGAAQDYLFSLLFKDRA
jgi:hypothetical protein